MALRADVRGILGKSVDINQMKVKFESAQQSSKDQWLGWFSQIGVKVRGN